MKYAHTPAWSFGKKTSADPKTSNLESPPPNSYNVRPDVIVVPTHDFGTGPRPELYKAEDNPGPGAYNIKSGFIKKKIKQRPSKTSTIQRSTAEKGKLETPGPGAYNPNKLRMTNYYSMGNKAYSLQASKSQHYLGPGQYDTKPSLSMKSTKFGTSKRPDLLNSNLSPGPAQYKVQTASSKPSFRYGPPPSKRSNTGSNSPSPNHYNIPDFTQGLNKKVGKSLTARRPEISIKSEIPDPGAYKIKLSPSSPSFSLGSGNRDSFIPSNNNPAPSEYSVSTAIIQKSKSTQFGKGTRPPLSVPNDNPGPGQYQVKSTIGDARKFQLHGRVNQPKSQMNNPGPGAYDANYAQTHRAISYKIGTGKRSGLYKSDAKYTPGPGHFTTAFGKGQGPYWSIGHSLKKPMEEDDEPGPGSYDIPNTVVDPPRYLIPRPESLMQVYQYQQQNVLKVQSRLRKRSENDFKYEALLKS